MIGQTLDDKYKIESEIGKGGMGTVYLATHVGTERPVALKVIASEFMERIEFVERFRREARAAGRLRHPNVVNVTDFGFSNSEKGKVAYLVMEYLDGCTLGEILEEEKQLPLSWTLDILEQVCSAVQEAHEQGIIHRDLKPDNIWLEPNQRGGYTVKVLDFGIAKLEEPMTAEAVSPLVADSALSANFQARKTVADVSQPPTIAENRSQTVISDAATMAQFPAKDSEAGTMIQPKEIAVDLESGTLIQSSEIDLESGTAIMPITPIRSLAQNANGGTKMISAQLETDKNLRRTASTSELTRVGAVLGTPLYMSPEQCRGEKLTAQSDIYSLGVITYQMLSGKTPFTGDYLDVMEAHKNTVPPPLEAKKIPKKIKKVINYALSKSIAERPPTAQAFASELRAQSEGIGVLLRRALTIYSEHLPKFIGLTLIIFLPVLLISLLKLLFDGLYAAGTIDKINIEVLNALFVLPVTFISIFCGQLITGTSTWLVVQFLSVPLRPLKIRTALAAMKKKWKRLIGTGLLSTGLTFAGLAFCGIGFPILSILFALVAPVVMMEDARGFAALKRSTTLVMRSPKTTIGAIFILFIVPMLCGAFIGIFVMTSVKSISDFKDKVAVMRRQVQQSAEKNQGTEIRIGGEETKIAADADAKNSGGEEADKESRAFREILRETLTTFLMFPVQILLLPLSSIVVALLYLKTRQIGGESMRDLIAQFEETDQPRTNWQRRVHERLEQSGKVTSKT